MHVSKPNFFASETLWSAMETDLTSPLNPTSPKQITPSGIGLFLYEDAIANIIPKSMAGSFI